MNSSIGLDKIFIRVSKMSSLPFLFSMSHLNEWFIGGCKGVLPSTLYIYRMEALISDHIWICKRRLKGWSRLYPFLMRDKRRGLFKMETNWDDSQIGTKMCSSNKRMHLNCGRDSPCLITCRPHQKMSTAPA